MTPTLVRRSHSFLLNETIQVSVGDLIAMGVASRAMRQLHPFACRPSPKQRTIQPAHAFASFIQPWIAIFRTVGFANTPMAHDVAEDSGIIALLKPRLRALEHAAQAAEERARSAISNFLPKVPMAKYLSVAACLSLFIPNAAMAAARRYRTGAARVRRQCSEILPPGAWSGRFRRVGLPPATSGKAKRCLQKGSDGPRSVTANA
ncbi:MAG: hypothetical protein JWQ17_4484 [Tardiphaga sp.]|nr:hypothetical protein [Tardiphaga sp.]